MSKIVKIEKEKIKAIEARIDEITQEMITTLKKHKRGMILIKGTIGSTDEMSQGITGNTGDLTNMLVNAMNQSKDFERIIKMAYLVHKGEL